MTVGFFEVNPDVQCDFTNMPYEDCTFSMVVFDPPHLVYSRGKKSKMVDMYGSLSEKAMPTGYQQIKYGALYSDWRDMLSKGFKECFRVLKSGGFLIFKWNETDVKVSEVLKLTSESQYLVTYQETLKYTLDMFYEELIMGKLKVYYGWTKICPIILCNDNY